MRRGPAGCQRKVSVASGRVIIRVTARLGESAWINSAVSPRARQLRVPTRVRTRATQSVNGEPITSAPRAQP